MSAHAPAAAGEQHRSSLLFELIKRLYALIIIAVVAYVSYRAVRYLVVTLMLPTPVPDQILGVPLRLDAAVLETRRDEWGALGEDRLSRSPLSHYHRITGWVQPDDVNTCTASGCHSALPHAERKEVRAFLNMHATSLHCGVCHMQAETPLDVTWYGLTDGAPQRRPALLAAYALLTSNDGAPPEPSDDVQQQIVSLLRAAARDADGAPALVTLADHLHAVRADSPMFVELLETARQALPSHFRGEYNAKLALREDGRPLLGHPGAPADAVRRLRTNPPERGSGDYEQLVAQVHPRRRSAPLQCNGCHVRDDGALTFADAGYPPSRVAALTQPLIFRMIENISKGQPFYMPGFAAGGDPAAPATELDSSP